MDITGTEGINVYADAKSEYTRQLSQFTLPALTGYFLNQLEDIKKEDNEAKKLLLNFQHSLKNIPEWNYEKVKKETEKILKDINCDYYEDLLSAVFVAHTKVLSAIRLSTKQKKLQITIPKVEHFLHHTLIECARILWSNVFLFSQNGSSIERQKNLRSIEQLLQDGILQSIRSMLPVKNILREYMKEDEEEDVKEEEKEEEIKQEEVKEEEVKEEEKEEVKEEETKQEEVKEPILEIRDKEDNTSTLDKVSSTVNDIPEQPLISVDTEPSVKFAEVNTVFNYDAENDLQETNIEEFEEITNKEDQSIEFEELP